MQLGPKPQSINAIIPWVILTLMTVYVFGLSFYSNNRKTPEPAFDFYGTTTVQIHIEDQGARQDSSHLVIGSYNNIIEGAKQQVEAKRTRSGEYEVNFRVNSPRSATLFVDDEAIEIFLVPDSNLYIQSVYDWDNFKLSALTFEGYTAGICDYYREKRKKFGRQHVRAYRTTVYADSLERHAHILDSLAIQELAYMLIRSAPNNLPDWFIDFEKNEILYQKAYLKLANAYNREIYEGYLDDIPLNDQSAVFSYYYYLYLRTYFQDRTASTSLITQLASADSLLRGEVKDVYLTQSIFSLFSASKTEQAQSLLAAYQDSFGRKKYERFLRKQLADGGMSRLAD